ncbi:MAG: PSD1 and planctomycete cytochrome C domain-containing protein, partial [Tunicatimonas sp.]|uniref:PSD1 and planctomycete cytochrome C domain-containing protein n=1 Tax=Tunicatimonas sp. TaxID=1940096 RepID=UPI003C75F03A
MNRAIKICWCFLFGFVLTNCGPSMPDDVQLAYQYLPDKVDFNFHVRPILSDRCFACHGPDENARESGLRLDQEEAIFANIPDQETFAVVASHPDESELVHRILSDDPELVMPTPESNLSLTAEEKAILIKWIEQGAEWKNHWAFDAPAKAALPEVNDATWPRNEIDYFVLDKLESLQLTPSEEADKETLIRRLSFDLNGLPPTPEEVTAFKEDTSKQAYENLIDRLLASPRYGERWAWEWLDVARYADTNGFQGDPTRKMWPWRDWVIRAFNENLPYDEFTVMQLAGDLKPSPTTEDILATAFNRNHTYNGEGGRIPEETRVENVLDRVETTGTAWLGLTLNCARCHDHKYDELTQREYYQFYDYFNQTSEEGLGGNGMIPPVLDLSSARDQQEVAELQEYVYALAEKVEVAERDKFPRKDGLPASESRAAEGLEGVASYALTYEPADRSSYFLSQLGNFFKEKDPAYFALIDDLRAARSSRDRRASRNLQVMVMDELKYPRTTYVLEKGGYDNPRTDEPIFRNVPAFLPPLPDDSKNNRLALAQWLVADEQPLTARVTVNRYWQAFFGNGLVKTIEDFGVQGALPTHPELLDWLAVDFRESGDRQSGGRQSGWNLKALLKKIVMSATYRQSSNVTEELLEIDPENKYLARATRMRLPSWMIRDQALYVSGLLVDSIGGPSVKPYQPEGIWEEATFGKIKYEQDHGNALYRRSLYTFWRRISGPTFLFDNSSRQVCNVKMLNTNTP